MSWSRAKEELPLVGLKDLICQASLVYPSSSFIPCLWVYVTRVSDWHSCNLILDAHLQSSLEFDDQSSQIRVASIQDQGLEEVQIVLYCPIILVVGGPFQSVGSICVMRAPRRKQSSIYLNT